MLYTIFFNSNRMLRNGWWIALFFIGLAALLVPLIIFASRNNSTVPIPQQLALIAVVSLVCQVLRRRPLAELVGRLDGCWFADLGTGLVAGAPLMVVPAVLLATTGSVSWHLNPSWDAMIGATLMTLLVAAAAEELLFRGFIFQRLIDGVGIWPAQLVISALFTLTHSDALSGQGTLAYLAGANIFLASLMFGFAYIRTRSLALPFGIHFAANATQGPMLGFGVSGSTEPGVLVADMGDAPSWLTGGTFGLEASVPGTICVALLTLAVWTSRQRAQVHL